MFAPKAALNLQRIAGGTAEGIPFVPNCGMKGLFLFTDNPLGGKHMKQQLESIRQQALTSLQNAQTPAELEDLRVQYLGKRASSPPF